MNIRTTVILFGILCASLLGFFLMTTLGVRTPEEQKEYEKWLLPSLNEATNRVTSSDITRVVIERHRHDTAKRERIEFTRRGKDWRMISPKDVRTGSGAVDNLIDQIMRAEKMQYAERTSSDLAASGLDDPATTIALYKGDTEYTLAIGNRNADDPILFVVSSDAPKKPRPLNRTRLDKVYAPIEEFRSKDLFTTTLDATGLRLTGGGRKPIELEKGEKDWQFKEPNVGKADSRATEDLIQTLNNLRVEKNADFIADGKVDLAKYGLDGDKALSVTLRRKQSDSKESVVETVLIGSKDATPAHAAGGALTAAAPSSAFAVAPLPGAILALTNHDAGLLRKEIGAVYAKPGEENYVVRIDSKHLQSLEKKPDELRSRDLVEIDATQADAINLTAGGETLRFRRPELKAGDALAAANWDLHADKRGKAKTHLNTVPNLIDALNKVELKDAKAFLDDGDKQREWFGTETIDLGLDKPQAEVLVWHEGIKRDKDGKPEGEGEPKLKDDAKDKPSIKLTFGRKDDKRGVVYVRRQIGSEPPAIVAVPDPYTATAEMPPSPPGQPPQQPPRETVRITSLLTGGYLAFRDHTLPGFKHNEATKLTYVRGGMTYVLEKEEKKDDKGTTTTQWKLKQPAGINPAARNVETLLFQLTGLSAEQIETDQATPQDLKDKYGLTEQPLIKAIVTTQEKDKKPAEHTYIIGKRTDPKGPKPDHFYARVEIKPAEGNPPDANKFVFLLRWLTVQSLDAELRDTTIFAEEKTAKPESVTFTWRKIDKDKKLQETKLEFVKKAAKDGAEKTWTVQSLTKDGKDAKGDLPKLDVPKLQQLIGEAAGQAPQALPSFGPRLNPLVTERFILHDGKHEAKHGLDPASKDNPPPLVIEVKYDNKTARTLTIGARWERKEEEQPGLTQPAYYFASASSLPKAVFVLGEGDWKGLVTGVDYFKVVEAAPGGKQP